MVVIRQVLLFHFQHFTNFISVYPSDHAATRHLLWFFYTTTSRVLCFTLSIATKAASSGLRYTVDQYFVWNEVSFTLPAMFKQDDRYICVWCLCFSHTISTACIVPLLLYTCLRPSLLCLLCPHKVQCAMSPLAAWFHLDLQETAGSYASFTSGQRSLWLPASCCPHRWSPVKPYNERLDIESEGP